MSEVDITEADRAKAVALKNARIAAAWRTALSGVRDRDYDEVDAIASALATARSEGRAERKAPPGCIVDCTGQISDGVVDRHAMSVTFNKQGDYYTADIRVQITKAEYDAHHERCRQAVLKSKPLTGCLDRKVRHG